uniref:Uncharacterized protein n=1 Tax=Panagrolaimus sp. JU765 TaxID=591449 RepID=A0AC34QWZ5_9BILA
MIDNDGSGHLSGYKSLAINFLFKTNKNVKDNTHRSCPRCSSLRCQRPMGLWRIWHGIWRIWNGLPNDGRMGLAKTYDDGRHVRWISWHVWRILWPLISNTIPSFSDKKHNRVIQGIFMIVFIL